MRKYKVHRPLKANGGRHAPGAEVQLHRHQADELVKSGVVSPVGGDDQAEGTPLPEDFPGKLPLEEAGVSTVEELREMTSEEIGGIKGIGRATVEKIEAALKAGA